jgi:hypothetical protein
MDRALGFVDILSRQGVPITIAVKNNPLIGMAKQNGIPVLEGLQTLAKLEPQDIMPSSDTYTVLMCSCCVAGEPARHPPPLSEPNSTLQPSSRYGLR